MNDPLSKPVDDASPEVESTVRTSDLLDLPEALQKVFRVISRQRSINVAELAERLQQDESEARSLLKQLLERDLVQELDIEGEQRYRVQLGFRQGRKVSTQIWDRLEGPIDG